MPPRPTERISFAGIDEAGYGPNLGPLVIASTLFDGPAELANTCWWEAFSANVARSSRDRRFWIDDSKRVLSFARGFQELERTVLSALTHLGCPGETLASLVEFVAPSDVEALTREHWFQPDDSPCARDARERWPAIDAQLRSVRARLLFPEHFNRQLAIHDNKSTVELEVVANLVKQLLADTPTDRDLVVWVDRLGGRRNYLEFVEELADGAFVSIVAQEERISAYRFLQQGRQVEIRFTVEADRRYLPVALASMVAKYLRERTMTDFNAYWFRQVPQLEPTAGYPKDAKRFLAQIQDRLDDLAILRDKVWRKR